MGNSDVFFENLKNNNSNLINVSLFAKVDSYNSTDNTIKAIPLSKESGRDIPVLNNVPIMQYSIGGFNIKPPVKKDDIVLIIFMDYDTDNLLLDGITVENNTNRTHAKDDAFALPFNFTPLQSSFTANTDVEISYTNVTTSKINISETDIVFTTPSGSVSVNSLIP